MLQNLKPGYLKIIKIACNDFKGLGVVLLKDIICL